MPLAQAIVAPAKLAGDAAAQMALATAIGAAAPDILVLTLGAPLSETFLHAIATCCRSAGRCAWARRCGSSSA